MPRLLDHGIKPSGGGKGRYRDNIFVERFWRTPKYECVHLHEWANSHEGGKGIGKYMRVYNNERPHKSLDKVPPAPVYHHHPNGIGSGSAGRFTFMLFRSASGWKTNLKIA